MKCNIVLNLLDSYADKELDDAIFLSVQSHLTACASCQSQLNEIKQVKQQLLDMPSPIMNASFEKNLQLKTKELKNKQLIHWSMSLAASITLLFVIGNTWLELGPTNVKNQEYSKVVQTDPFELDIDNLLNSTQMAHITLTMECEELSKGGNCTFSEIAPQS
jgi:hypothetical protein